MDVFRNDLLAYAFDQIRGRFDQLSGFFICFEDRPVRISADDLDIGVLLFQVSACARNSPTSSQSCDKMRNLSIGLFPKFRTSRFVMRERVVWIRVLEREERIRRLFGNA